MNALQLYHWRFWKKKLCGRLSSREVQFFSWKTAIVRFWAPFEGLRATYDVHLRLIVKRVVDFLLVIIKLFFARRYGWGATSGYRFLKISVSVSTIWPKISGRRRRLVPRQPFFLSEKYMKGPFIRQKNVGIRFFRLLFTIHAFDRQTDGRTDISLMAQTAPQKMQRGKKYSRIKRTFEIKSKRYFTHWSRRHTYLITLLHDDYFMAHWKACSQLPLSVNWTFFR